MQLMVISYKLFISYKLWIFYSLFIILCQPINSQALIIFIFYIYIIYFILSVRKTRRALGISHTAQSENGRPTDSKVLTHKSVITFKQFSWQTQCFVKSISLRSGILTNTISLPALFKALAKAFSWKKAREFSLLLFFAVQPNPPSILVLLPVRGWITKT